jgi:hypothetical protein
MTNEVKNVEQEANCIAHAEARAIRTIEQCEAHVAQRVAMFEKVRGKIRRNDRAVHAKQMAIVPNWLPQVRREFDGNNECLRHKLGRMEVRCDHCDTLHWIEERVTSSL